MKNMIRQVVQINSALGRQLEKRNHRSVQATGAACVGNLFIGIGKLLLGIISLSFFYLRECCRSVSCKWPDGSFDGKSCCYNGIIDDDTYERTSEDGIIE